MSKKAQDNFTLRVKKRLLDKGMSITHLSQRIGRSRNAVSIAINHPRMYAGVRADIVRELELTP